MELTITLLFSSWGSDASCLAAQAPGLHIYTCLRTSAAVRRHHDTAALIKETISLGAYSSEV